MAFPVIALLAVGGIALMAASSGRGGGFRLFDGQCRLIPRTVANNAQATKLANRVAALIDRAIEDVTGASGSADATLQQILGEAPGDLERNLAFIRATVTRVLQISATPACLKKLDVVGPQNAFGEDWSEVALPDDMAELFLALGADMMMVLDMQGYDVGVQYSQVGPTAPYQATVARISR